MATSGPEMSREPQRFDMLAREMSEALGKLTASVDSEKRREILLVMWVLLEEMAKTAELQST